MLHNAFQAFINVPAATWLHVLGWFLGTAFVSGVILAISHVRGKFAEVTTKFKVFVTGAISFLVAASAAILGTGVDFSTLGKNGLAIAGALTFVYHLGTNPLYKKYIETKKAEPLAPLAQSTQPFEG